MRALTGSRRLRRRRRLVAVVSSRSLERIAVVPVTVNHLREVDVITVAMQARTPAAVGRATRAVVVVDDAARQDAGSHAHCQADEDDQARAQVLRVVAGV